MTPLERIDREGRRELAALLFAWALIGAALAWAMPARAAAAADFRNVIGGACPCVVSTTPAVVEAIAQAPVPQRAPGVKVPERARQYQRQLTAEAHTVFGLQAPIATLAAQLHQESGWAWNVSSNVGAQGLAQFMPGTAADLARQYPTELGPADPNNPAWAIKAQTRYMRDLARAAPGRTECDTWAFALSSYNGGLGWLRRDQAVARAKGLPADTWFGAVEVTADTRRAPANVKQNRDYPRRILLLIAPTYAGDWGRAVTCVLVSP